MTDRLFFVGFRWIKTPAETAAKLEGTMGELGNWARLNSFIWFLWSDKKATEISDRLRKELAPGDGVIVLLANPNEYAGLLSPWFWEWIERKPVTNPPSAATAPKLPTPPSDDFSNALTAGLRKKYYVVLHQGAWKVLVDGVHYGPYPTQALAIRAAVDAAQKIGSMSFGGSQVLVQGANNQFRTEWTYGRDPYPPRG